MLFIPLHLIILAGLMYLMAKHEADINWPKMALVFAPLIILLSMISHLLGILAIPAFFIGILFCLHQWFYVGWGKASAISGIFMVYLIIFGMIISNFTGSSRRNTGSHSVSNHTTLLAAQSDQ